MISHSIWSLNKKGFTLIELLVVISIMGILSSVIMAPFNEARKKGRDAKRVAELKAIQSSLQLYADDHHGCYPDASAIPIPFADNSLSANNYKYISKTLYNKIKNNNVASLQSNFISVPWTAIQPYGYRGEGNFVACGTIINTSVPIYNSFHDIVGFTTSITAIYLPTYQLFVELEAHTSALDGDNDSDLSNVDVEDTLESGQLGGGEFYIGKDLSSPNFETCIDSSVGNWDCVYDLTN